MNCINVFFRFKIKFSKKKRINDVHKLGTALDFSLEISYAKNSCEIKLGVHSLYFILKSYSFHKSQFKCCLVFRTFPYCPD